MFFARAYRMNNGYCGVMASPTLQPNCKTRLFFSNPSIKYRGEPTGRYFANNALWVKHNRFALAYAGNEEVKFPENHMYKKGVLDCFMKSAYADVNCDDEFEDYSTFV